MGFTRRGVLTGAAIGGGVVLAWALFPRTYPNPLEPGRDELAFDAWLKIGRDGVVTVAVPQLEMGQGVTTLLPQIIAAELGADWRQMAVEPAPVSGAYANVPLAEKWAPLWIPYEPEMAEEAGPYLAERYAQTQRFSATADGTTLAAFERSCRIAAAKTRAMLAQAAAREWNVAPEECSAVKGFIVHEDKRLSFGELASAAAEETPPDPSPLRSQPYGEQPVPAEQREDEGGSESPYQRIDFPSKVDGSFLFAGDVRLPGMVYAAIRHGPVDEAELASFDASAAEGMRGFITAVEGKRWLAATASNWWAAERALDAMKPRFNVQRQINSEMIDNALDSALRDGQAYRMEKRGQGYDTGGKSNIAARYDFDPAVHASIETSTATARLEDGRLELWIASQAPEAARSAAAKALDLALDDVVIYPMPAGGSFDRRLEHDHAIEVAMLARELSKDEPRPVQLIWSRWQEQLRTRPRTPASVFIGARVSSSDQGTITGMQTRIACPPTNHEFGRRLFANKTSWAAMDEVAGKRDAMALEGAMPPYAIGDVSVDHVPATIGLPTGRMRGNAHSYTAFATECFIDEAAARYNREPLSYRISLLGSDLRMVECLQRAARLAGWDGGVEQSGQGLACHRIGSWEGGGRIACVAFAQAGEGGVRVARLVAAVDIGRIVNLDIARQQIEGGLIFGLAQALGASTRYEDGLPTAQSLGQLNLPKLAGSPKVEVDFVMSNKDPFDPGELGAVVAPPAIANALHSATGLRLRRLPLLSGGL
jgi:isoquinoline 1-oxidoreductase beta subunit